MRADSGSKRGPQHNVPVGDLTLADLARLTSLGIRIQEPERKRKLDLFKAWGTENESRLDSVFLLRGKRDC